jgi:putative transposase
LSPEEREAIRAVLCSPDHADQPPAEVYARLLEQGRYLASVSSFHRILRAADAHGERRLQRPPQSHAIPRLQAQAPNEVWTWDVTKLATRRRGDYLSLYVVLDLYSRYVLAWMVSLKENSALAQQLMQDAMTRYEVAYACLTLHQDRGAPMIAQGFLDLMAELGVTCSHSRPRVSNDNAFSEAQNKTLKYQPDYPGRFTSLEHARRWCEDYFNWYNFSHHHSGIGYYTPGQVFTGDDHRIAELRQRALDTQYREHPERFVNGPPKTARPPKVVVINPYPVADGETGPTTGPVNFPTLPAAKKVAA